MTDLRDLLKRIRQWDALDIPNTDGAYWKREIDAALEQPEREQGPELRELLIAAAAMAVAADRKGAYQGASWVADAMLEQPEQEPVAWMYVGLTVTNNMHGPHLVWKPEQMDAMSAEKGVVASPLFTHPPRREWRSLNEGALMGLYVDFDRKKDKKWSDVEYLMRFLDVVQAKLKELNHE